MLPLATSFTHRSTAFWLAAAVKNWEGAQPLAEARDNGAATR